MAEGNRRDIVLPEVRRSELACNWILTNGDQSATKSKLDIVKESHLESKEGVVQGSAKPWVLRSRISKGWARG